MQATTTENGGVYAPLYRTEIDPRADWAEEIMVAFEGEHGEEGEHVQNLVQVLSYLHCWCDCNGFQWEEALKLAAARYSEESA